MHHGISFYRINNVIHLVAVLTRDEPCGSIIPDGLPSLPLCYGFRFPATDFQYLVNNKSRVEILSNNLYSRSNLIQKLQWRMRRLEQQITGTVKWDHSHQYRPDFPYEGHPDIFDKCKIRFDRKPYDPTKAEDALNLQGVFGLSYLSTEEMQRAAEIGLKNPSFVSDPEYYDEYGWTAEQKVNLLGRSPFYQAAPSKWCDNPKCSSGEREDTVKVIAIHEPDDDVMWGSMYVQLIFTICDRCRRVAVSNQCT